MLGRRPAPRRPAGARFDSHPGSRARAHTHTHTPHKRRRWLRRGVWQMQARLAIESGWLTRGFLYYESL